MGVAKVTCMLVGVMFFIGSIHGASFFPDDNNSKLETNGTKDTRDLTGQYHGEHHHAHVHNHESVHSTDVSGNAIQVTTVGVHHQDGVGILQGPPTPVAEVAPHCLCVVRSTGCIGREAYTKQFEGISTLVCGLSFERCCFEDPWPGVVDAWASKAPCVPQEVCPRWYGQAATDVRDFGVMGPCPGAGAVRCVQGIVGNAEEDIGLVAVVPAAPPAPVLTVLPPPPVETIVVPIVPQPTPTEPPRVVETPAPQIVIPPPAPAPTFAVVPEYEAPIPVSTYVPPVPVSTYVPPVPVSTYVPPVPVSTYVPPVPVSTYEPPVSTNEPVVTPPLAPAYTPGPPYLWRNLGFATPYYGLGYNGYGGGYNGFGYGGWPFKSFQIHKRFGFGYGF